MDFFFVGKLRVPDKSGFPEASLIYINRVIIKNNEYTTEGNLSSYKSANFQEYFSIIYNLLNTGLDSGHSPY